jgi:hypothetical protein
MTHLLPFYSVSPISSEALSAFQAALQHSLGQFHLPKARSGFSTERERSNYSGLASLPIRSEYRRTILKKIPIAKGVGISLIRNVLGMQAIS